MKENKYLEIVSAMRLLREVDNIQFADACVTMLHEQGYQVYSGHNSIIEVFTKHNQVLTALSQPVYALPLQLLPTMTYTS